MTKTLKALTLALALSTLAVPAMAQTTKEVIVHKTPYGTERTVIRRDNRDGYRYHHRWRRRRECWNRTYWHHGYRRTVRHCEWR